MTKNTFFAAQYICNKDSFYWNFHFLKQSCGIYKQWKLSFNNQIVGKCHNKFSYTQYDYGLWIIVGSAPLIIGTLGHFNWLFLKHALIKLLQTVMYFFKEF